MINEIADKVRVKMLVLMFGDGAAVGAGGVHTSHSGDDQMNHQLGVNHFLTPFSIPPCL